MKLSRSILEKKLICIHLFPFCDPTWGHALWACIRPSIHPVLFIHPLFSSLLWPPIFLSLTPSLPTSPPSPFLLPSYIHPSIPLFHYPSLATSLSFFHSYICIIHPSSLSNLCCFFHLSEIGKNFFKTFKKVFSPCCWTTLPWKFLQTEQTSFSSVSCWAVLMLFRIDLNSNIVNNK